MTPSRPLLLTGCLLAVAANAAELDPAVARDFERFGARQECYLPEGGESVLNRGFQHWSYLVLNMAVWRVGGELVTEFWPSSGGGRRFHLIPRTTDRVKWARNSGRRAGSLPRWLPSPGSTRGGEPCKLRLFP